MPDTKRCIRRKAVRQHLKGAMPRSHRVRPPGIGSGLSDIRCTKKRGIYATKGDATSWGCTSAKGDVNSYKKGRQYYRHKKGQPKL